MSENEAVAEQKDIDSTVAEVNSESFAHVEFIDRYFTHYLCPSTKLLYLQHTNALVCVVTLSDGHELLQQLRQDKSRTDSLKVSYTLSNGVDRSCPLVSGKSKRGAQIINNGDVLCEVSFADTVIPVVCSITGSIIEVNERLVKNPELLWNEPRGKGFLAILLLKRPRKGKRYEETVFKNMQVVHRSPEEILEEESIDVEAAGASADTTESTTVTSSEASSSSNTESTLNVALDWISNTTSSITVSHSGRSFSTQTTNSSKSSSSRSSSSTGMSSDMTSSSGSDTTLCITVPESDREESIQETGKNEK